MYRNKIFDALQAEYNKIQRTSMQRAKNVQSAREMATRIFSESYGGVPPDSFAVEELESAIRKIEEQNAIEEQQLIEKFEEILKDPSVLRGRILGSNLGITDEQYLEPFVGNFNDCFVNAPTSSPVPAPVAVTEPEDLPF